MKIKLLESCGIFLAIMSFKHFDESLDSFNKKEMLYSILCIIASGLIFILV